MSRPFSVLVKPTGAVCNLDCTYCYFLSKEQLYPDGRFRMSDDVLESYIEQLLAAQPGAATIAWQGGEPTMMGLDFFRRSIELVDKHRQPGQDVGYTIQTNATLIDEDWASFFREHEFLVGVSIDGPRHLHDVYRRDKRGNGTFDRVIAGYETLRRHHVDVNVLCTVHAANQDHPLEVYKFFRASNRGSSSTGQPRMGAGSTAAGPDRRSGGRSNCRSEPIRPVPHHDLRRVAPA